MMLLRLAFASLWNRRITALLTVMSLAISVLLLTGINHLRHEAKESFNSTVSGTDLIIGARSGSMNLLLYSVFRIGNATNNIRWRSYEAIAADPAVAWTIPLSLGDSHRGFRVMGTNEAYFEYFHYGDNRALVLADGRPFSGVYDAVIGSSVARELGYTIGQSITLSHGLASVGSAEHADKPFTIVGILDPTGTPVDRTLHVSLAGIEAIHVDWQSGTRLPGKGISAEAAAAMDLAPKAITAALVGLKSRVAVFGLQRSINNFRQEPLMAILPGVALAELWQIMSVIENLLLLVSGMVLLATLTGMVTTLLASIQERQREIAILRALGLSTRAVFLLIELEAVVLAFAGAAVGLMLLSGALYLGQPWLLSRFGLQINPLPLDINVLILLLSIAGLAALAALIPAVAAYRRALHEGLNART